MNRLIIQYHSIAILYHYVPYLQCFCKGICDVMGDILRISCNVVSTGVKHFSAL